jgi:hypothetical protein
MPTGVFSAWDAEIVNRENEQFPLRFCTWFEYQPADTTLLIRGQDGNPLAGAQVKVYANDKLRDPDKPPYAIIPDVPKWSGDTTDDGRFHMGAGVLEPARCGKPSRAETRIFLVEIELNGQVDYQWFNFMDVNFAFWNQEDILLQSSLHAGNG